MQIENMFFNRHKTKGWEYGDLITMDSQSWINQGEINWNKPKKGY
jgi:hypothetical protein